MPLTFFWVFLVLMVSGIPIVFALAAGPLAGFLLADQSAFLKMLPQRMFGGIAQFPILAIPLFILAGEVMNVSGITKSLVNFANVLIGHVRAGLAQANIVASIMFAGLSGSAVADTSALGSIFIPAMEKDGYSRAFSAAVTAASSVIGPIIPPSIIMVIYAYVMNVSVAALFLAGIVPGVLIGVGLMVVTAIIGKKRNYPKAHRRATTGEVWAAFKPAALPLMTPVIIMGGIVSGIVTPTEAAGAAVLYALVLSMLITRTVTPRDLVGIFYRTGLVSSSILLIVGSATIFGWAATVSGVPQALGRFLFTITENPFLLLLLINVLLLVIGMFLDAVPAILILGPIFAPALAQVGIDPVHFAIIMCVNVTVGLVTPPMGMILFVASGLTRTGIEVISKELWPYLAVHFFVIVLISMVPALTLTIPRLFGFM
ncbi:TRAP transporter large permease [Paracoccus sp. Z330]|uniref:TRAP transporter large permease protein n=1 Tax=Paracoccus onchidii TaxID=3017813 RepID=A0ABT4ZJU3_9RHOB|nr:TRAP transporter large permease [Paracoccus onchidii]MDB6179583.1 TRAP transporter large permease [Paracoccus onchidii]